MLIQLITAILKFLRILYRVYIFDPLAGGNGKIQMDELVKAVMVVMIISASIKEGKSPEQFYPDIYWICIFSGVIGIATIKPAFTKFQNGKGNSDINPM